MHDECSEPLVSHLKLFLYNNFALIIHRHAREIHKRLKSNDDWWLPDDKNPAEFLLLTLLRHLNQKHSLNF